MEDRKKEVREERNKKMHLAVYLQIFLLIGMTFAFSYFMHESRGLNGREAVYKIKKNNFSKYELLKAIGFIGKLIFNEKSFVSALTAEDAQKGAYTCLKSKDGKICQEYPASECADKCLDECIPTSPNEVSQCSLGTCYNPVAGKCSLGSPKALCESEGGKWSSDINGNIPECKQGCCVLGGEAYLGTAVQCEKDASIRGLKKDFRPEANTELRCLGLAKTQEEGACVFQEELENGCKFTTKLECMQSIKGKFYSGYLCSNQELKTKCKPQQTVKCAENKDEVYWYDSCGNRENIYDANKVKSLNNGRVLAKDESCSLQAGSNAFANQGKCGNCDYLQGSICGKETSGEKLSDSGFDFVCRDLSCKDENGKKREHGESWCAYQGAIGVDKNRGSDTPGSRHYRKSCINGEIKIDPCADYRNEICVESQTKINSGSFSSAACRINLAYTCYEYNKEGKKEQCEKNPDCFIKKVDVSKDFKFDFCAPKYKPGFDLNERGDGAEGICNIGTQKCKYIKITGLGGDKEINKECITSKFSEQMNDFCMSLGDCGAQINYQGAFTENYKIIKGKKASQTYIKDIQRYSDEKLFKGQFAQPGEKFFAEELGIPGFLGQANYKAPSASKDTMMLSGVLGVAGIAAKLGAAYLPGAATALPAGTLGPVAPATGASAAVAAVGGAAAGAAVGLAMTSFLLDSTGVGRGLPPIVYNHLLAAGAAGGALVGLAVAGKAGAAGSTIAAAAPVLAIVGIVIIVVVIIVIIIFMALGIGKVKKITVTFTCKPWQAPNGGKDCSKCGQDGFPCSKYACQSLGQTCQYINEETENPECIAIEQNDSAPPVIRAMKELLPEGYSSEENELGVKIKSSESDGCIKETFQAIPFGIQLNEPGQCRMEFNHTNSWDEMEFDLAGRSMYLKNHSLPIIVPSLESLGLEGIDPKEKSDFNIYVRCQDKLGNINEREFNINFCIKQGPDTTPAIVVEKDPSEALAFNATQVNATVYTNEPAECRWDTSDTAYNLMGSSFACETDIEDRKLFGWPCNSVLPISNSDSTFYVRCLDQPWLKDSNESARNPNRESYELKFKKSSSLLKIASIKPNNESINVATEPTSITLEVKTSGGLDGTATCSYQIGSSGFIEFRHTLTETHKQVLETLLSGEVEIPVRCEDLAGNVAESKAEFSIKIDAESPRVSRIYGQEGNLIVVTNEEAKCYYSLDNKEQCLFDINNETISFEMSGAGLSHSSSFTGKDKYYIKCRDNLGNYPGSCSAIVKEGKI